MDCALPVLSGLWSFQACRGLSCGLCGLRSGPQSLSAGFLGPKVLSTGFLGGPNRTGLPRRPYYFPSLAPQNRANGSRHPQSPGFWASPGLSRGLQGSPIPSIQSPDAQILVPGHLNPGPRGSKSRSPDPDPSPRTPRTQSPDTQIPVNGSPDPFKSVPDQNPSPDHLSTI